MLLSLPAPSFLTIIASCFCIILVVFRAISLEIFYFSDLARPFLYILLVLLASSLHLRPHKSLLLLRIILFISIAQFLFSVLQVFFYANPIVRSLSLILSSDTMVNEFQYYHRATGFFGGPAPSGVFIIIAMLTTLYLKRIHGITNKSFVVLSILYVSQAFMMLSKASLFFCVTVLVSISLNALFLHFFSRRIANLLAVFSLISFICFVCFSVLVADIGYMRDSGGFLGSLSRAIDLSSLNARLGYHQENVLLVGGASEIFFGAFDSIRDFSSGRVFDSDFLYFLNVYGLSGLFLNLSLFWFFVRSLPAFLRNWFIIGLLAAMVFVNPFFTAILPLPFLFIFIVASESLKRFRAIAMN